MGHKHQSSLAKFVRGREHLNVGERHSGAVAAPTGTRDSSGWAGVRGSAHRSGQGEGAEREGATREAGY